MQQPTGRLAALGRFIFRFTNHLKPFFATLRGANRAGWNEECDWAFIHIKQYLAKPPIFTSLDIDETLFVYLAVSDITVSAALFKENEDWWTLNVDGASRKTSAGIGLQLKSPSRDNIKQAIRLGFSASNNESEYEAILAGLELVAALFVGKLLIQSDSQLMVGQVNEEFESRDPRMVKYVSRVKQRLSSFPV